MDAGLLLLIIGLIVALFVHWLVGVVLIVIGAALLLAGRT